MPKVNEFLGEKSGQTLKAEIHTEGTEHTIQYYVNNNLQKMETFHGKSIFYVEDAATNWIAGIKVLNG
jgi:hypothetical protein